MQTVPMRPSLLQHVADPGDVVRHPLAFLGGTCRGLTELGRVLQPLRRMDDASISFSFVELDASTRSAACCGIGGMMEVTVRTMDLPKNAQLPREGNGARPRRAAKDRRDVMIHRCACRLTRRSAISRSGAVGRRAQALRAVVRCVCSCVDARGCVDPSSDDEPRATCSLSSGCAPRFRRSRDERAASSRNPRRRRVLVLRKLVGAAHSPAARTSQRLRAHMGPGTSLARQLMLEAVASRRGVSRRPSGRARPPHRARAATRSNSAGVAVSSCDRRRSCREVHDGITPRARADFRYWFERFRGTRVADAHAPKSKHAKRLSGQGERVIGGPASLSLRPCSSSLIQLRASPRGQDVDTPRSRLCSMQ